MSRFCNRIFQTEVSSTRHNRSFNLPYSRLLACVKCSVLHLQQSRWVLLCTHVCRLHFSFNTDYGWHEMCPLRFLSVLSSAKNTSSMIGLWSEATWSYRGGISGEIANFPGLKQVCKFGSQRVKYFEICDFLQPMGILTRTFSLTSFCFWFA